MFHLKNKNLSLGLFFGFSSDGPFDFSSLLGRTLIFNDLIRLDIVKLQQNENLEIWIENKFQP